MRVQTMLLCLTVAGPALAAALPTGSHSLETREISTQGFFDGIVLDSRAARGVLPYAERGDSSKAGKYNGKDDDDDDDDHDDNDKKDDHDDHDNDKGDDDEDCDNNEKGNGGKKYKPSKGY